MNILSIHPAASQWLWLGIAGFAIMLGLSIIAWALRTAECYEHEEDPVTPVDDMMPVSYQEVIDCERPYISFQ